MRVLGSFAVLVAALAVAALAPARAAAARIVTWEIQSAHVDPAKDEEGYNNPSGTPRPAALRVNVYLPDGYDERSPRRYPVLYLLHGVGDAFDSWSLATQGNVLEVARGFPGFIVMPEADRGFYTNWWNGGRRADPAWERHHLDELVPLVERRLPIRPGRRWHAIYGFSMGGMGAMLYASRRPGYFGSVGASQGLLSLERPQFQADPVFRTFIEQDPRAIFGDPLAQEFYWSGHNPTELVDTLTNTRLYVAAGDGIPAEGEPRGPGQVAEVEIRLQAEEFVAAARAAGAAVTYRPQRGSHEWVSRRRHLAEAISEWGLFEPVPEAPPRWRYETVSQTGRMWDLDFAFTAPPDRVQRFERNGAVLTGAGAGEVRIETAEGCAFTATLPFARELPSCPAPRARLRLAVSPSRVTAGVRRRFRFRATLAAGTARRPAAGVTIRFAGRRTRTNRDGLATIATRLPRRGRYVARASGRGLVAATTAVRVVSPRSRRSPRFVG